jgi:hypothetical protein
MVGQDAETPTRFDGQAEKAGGIECVTRCENNAALPLLEIARLLVRFDHIPSRVVNANHGIM